MSLYEAIEESPTLRRIAAALEVIANELGSIRAVLEEAEAEKKTLDVME